MRSFSQILAIRLILISIFALLGCSNQEGKMDWRSRTAKPNAISPSSGFTGGRTRVTISGENLLSGATVLFDSSPCTGVSVASDGKSLTCLTPAHAAGTSAVTITNPFSFDATMATQFTYATDAFNTVEIAIGSSSYGYADGIGTLAQFTRPTDVATDGTYLYVADYENNTIRKIKISTKEVTTLAGSPGEAGSTDGIGSAARFDGPMGLATDGVNVFVSDFRNHTIRKIVISTGTVTTLAGTAGITGSADGIGPAASFRDTYSLDTDGTYLYVSDYGNHILRKIEIATGTVTTIAGTAGVSGSVDDVGSAARLTGPGGLRYYGGSLYWVDYGTNKIRSMVLTSGAVSTLAGSGTRATTDGTGLAADFNGPWTMSVDGTNLYVGEYDGCTVRKVVIATGVTTTLAGDSTRCSNYGMDGTGTSAIFYRPYGAAYYGGYVYIADYGTNSVRRLNVSTAAVTTFAGSLLNNLANGSGSATGVDYYSGLTTDGTSLFITSYYGQQIRKLSLSSFTTTALAGNPMVSGAADGTGTAATFKGPWGITSLNGKLYSLDVDNNIIRKTDQSTGAVTTLAGTAGVNGSTDGVGAAALFYFGGEGGITNDGTYLYVADYRNHTIRKVDPASGTVTTLAGTAGVSGAADGTGLAATFLNPTDLIYTGGNLYVADYGNCLVRQVNIATGAVTTLAGTAASCSYADGTGAAGLFRRPYGIATDGVNLYVGDQFKVRKVVIATGEVSTLYGSDTGNGYWEKPGDLTTARSGFAMRLVFNASYGLFVSTTSSVQWIH